MAKQSLSSQIEKLVVGLCDALSKCMVVGHSGCSKVDLKFLIILVSSRVLMNAAARVPTHPEIGSRWGRFSFGEMWIVLSEQGIKFCKLKRLYGNASSVQAGSDASTVMSARKCPLFLKLVRSIIENANLCLR